MFSICEALYNLDYTYCEILDGVKEAVSKVIGIKDFFVIKSGKAFICLY